ncbi:MAG: hypothetical protein ABEH77_04170, partial [Halobacteriaceae archaeon]
RHDPEAEDPLGDLAADVGGRDEEELDAIFEEAFTEMEVEDVDADDVWEELERDETPAERAAEPEQEVRTQHKNVCHSCEYFSEPPSMHCTHEGTEIRRVVDADHYEVVDCPMGVAEDLE